MPYILCLFLCTWAAVINAAAIRVKQVDNFVNSRAIWVLDGKHWRAEANVPHATVAKAGALPQSMNPALGRYILSRDGLVAVPAAKDGPYKVRLQNSGFALISLGLNRSTKVSELILDGVVAVWQYAPDLRSYQVYRPTGVYLAYEHRLEVVFPEWPVFVEASQPDASITVAGAQAEWLIDGGARGHSTAPALSFKPISQMVLGTAWPLVSGETLHSGPLREVRFQVEASPAMSTGLELEITGTVAGKAQKIAGALLSAPLVHEITISLPMNEEITLQAAIVDRFGNTVISRVFTVSKERQDSLSLQAELARLLEGETGPERVVRASVSTLNSGFQEAPGNFLGADLQHIQVFISGPDIQTQSFEFSGATTSARLQVPLGNNRTIRVDYLDSARSLIRRGQRILNVLEPIQGLALEPVATDFPDLVSFPSSGYFADSIEATLSASSAEIVYTLDNSNPKTSPSARSAIGSTSVALTQTTTIKAFVRLAGGQESGTRHFHFVREVPPTPTVQALTGDLFEGAYFTGSIQLSITGSGQVGERIRFADDTSFPLPHSLTLTESTTLTFQTVSRNGVRSSQQQLAFFQIELPQLAFEISSVSVEQFFAGTAVIDLSSNVPGTKLYYTLDDSTPSLASDFLILPAELELQNTATLRGFLKHPLGFTGPEFAHGFVKAPLPDPESLPDGYVLITGEIASFPLSLDSEVSVSILSAPLSGSLTVSSSEVDYTPQTGFVGEDYFTLEFLHEPTGLVLQREFLMIVEPLPNQGPVFASLSSQTTLEDTLLIVPLTIQDPDGDPLSVYAEVIPSQNGTATLVNGSEIHFNPAPNSYGMSVLSIRVCDESKDPILCVTQHIDVDVQSVDEAPELQVSSGSISFNRNNTYDLSFAVLEFDGDATNVEAVAYTGSQTEMVLSNDVNLLLNNGVLSIVPAANFYGNLFVGLKACDDTLADPDLCDFVEIPVTINFVNQSPITTYNQLEVSISLDEDEAHSETFSVMDPEGFSVATTVHSAPIHGLVVVSGSGFTYTPNADYFGLDSFVLAFTDSEGGSSYQTFVVSLAALDDAPELEVLGGSIIFDRNTTYELNFSVLESDGDITNVEAIAYTGSQSSMVIVSDLTLVLNAGVLSIVPAANFYGNLFVGLKACDDSLADPDLCDFAEIPVTINFVNQSPITTYNQLEVPISLNEDEPHSETFSVMDPEGFSVATTVHSSPNQGAVVISGFGFTYTPNADYHGMDSFVLAFTDSEGGSSYQTFVVSLAALDDAPELEVLVSSISFDRNTTYELNFSVLESDGDITNVEAVAYTGSQSSMVVVSDVTLLVNAGVLSIVPATNFYGNLFVGLEACDDSVADPDLCDFVEIPVSINFVNQSPITTYNQLEVPISLNEDEPHSETFSVMDPEGFSVATTVHSSPNQGAVVISGFGFTYTPNADYHGMDSFVLAFTDSEGGSSYQTFVATILPVNDVPEFLYSGAILVPENESLATTVQVTDLDGDLLTLQVLSTADSHLLTLDVGTGALAFVTAPDFENPLDGNADNVYEVFVSANDGAGGVTTQLYEISVQEVLEGPVLQPVADISLDEDFGRYIVTYDLTVADGTLENLQAHSSNPGILTVGGLHQGKLLLNSIPDQFGSVTVTITASSSIGSDSVSFAVQVSPVFDYPHITNPRDISFSALGGPGMSIGATDHHALIVGPDGHPVVSYQDNSFGSPKAVVKAWNGSSWDSLGVDGFSTGTASYQSLGYDSLNRLYLAYQDGSVISKASLLQFDGSDWHTVGLPGITPGTAQRVRLALDSADRPYVSFQDVPNGSKASVVSISDGTWSQVGLAGISVGAVDFLDLTIDPLDRLLIAYRDSIASGRTYVHRYENGVWNRLSLSELNLATNAAWQSIRTDRFAIPHLAYIDQDNAELVLARYGLSGWEELARTAVASGTADKFVTLRITRDDRIFVAFRNADVMGGDSQVFQLVNGQFLSQGYSSGLAMGDTNFTAMDLGPDGVIYVAYRDPSSGAKTTVQKSNALGLTANVLENQSQVLSINVHSPETSARVFTLDGLDSSHFEIDSAGVLTFVTAPDFESPSDSGTDNHYQLIVSVDVDAYTTSVDMSIFVSNVNEAPILAMPFTTGLQEDFGSNSITLSAFDPEGDPIVYQATSSNPSVVATPVIDGNILNFIPVPNAYGEAVITVTAVSGGQSHTQTFLQTIVPANDPPSLTNSVYTTWEFLGGTNITETSVNDGLGLAVNSLFEPHLAFSDNAWSGRISVINYYADDWNYLGAGGFSTGSASLINLVLDSGDVPYVAYRDAGLGNRASVKYFDGSFWTSVGDLGFTSEIHQLSLALSPTSTPYVAYSVTHAGIGKVSVQRYTGVTWEFVGEPFLRMETDVQMDFPSIAVDNNGAPYVIYRHSVVDLHEQVASVLKFDGTNWVQVGPIGFSGSPGIRNIYDPYIAIGPNNEPVVGYRDRGSPGFNRASVLRFDGSNWVTYGPQGFSEGEVNNMVFAFDFHGMPWASYRDDAYSGSAVVKRFDGSNWSFAGTPGISEGSGNDLRIAMNPFDIPVIAYRQASNQKPAVRQLAKYLRHVVSENQTFQTSMTVTDIDGDTLFTYALFGADSNWFSINTSGEIALLSPLNFEAPQDQNQDNIYEFTVDVADAFGGITSVLIKVQVTDVNEAPYAQFTKTANPADTVMSWKNSELVTTVDRLLYLQITEDEGQTYTAQILNGGVTELGTASEYTPGILQFAYSEPFTPGVTEIQIELCDDSGIPQCQTITIPIDVVAYALPTITFNQLGASVFEGQSVQFPYYISSEGPEFNLQVLVDAQQGSVTFDQFAPSGIFTFQAGVEYQGPDSFTVRFNDGVNDVDEVINVTIMAAPPVLGSVNSDNPRPFLNEANSIYVDLTYFGIPQSETWTLLEYPDGASTVELEQDLVDAALAYLTPTIPGRYKVQYQIVDQQGIPQVRDLTLDTADVWVEKPEITSSAYVSGLQVADDSGRITIRFEDDLYNTSLKVYNGHPTTFTVDTSLPFATSQGIAVSDRDIYVAVDVDSVLNVIRTRNGLVNERVGQALPLGTFGTMQIDRNGQPFLCQSGSSLAVRCYRFDGNHWIQAGPEFGEATTSVLYPQLRRHVGDLIYSALHFDDVEAEYVPRVFHYQGSAFTEISDAVPNPEVSGINSYKIGIMGRELWALIATDTNMFISRYDLVNGPMTGFNFNSVDIARADLLVDDRGDGYLAYMAGQGPAIVQAKRFNVISHEWEVLPFDESQEIQVSVAGGNLKLARLYGVPHLILSGPSGESTLKLYGLDITANPLVSYHNPLNHGSAGITDPVTVSISRNLPVTALDGTIYFQDEANFPVLYNATVTNSGNVATLEFDLTNNLSTGRQRVGLGTSGFGAPFPLQNSQGLQVPPYSFDFKARVGHTLIGSNLKGLSGGASIVADLQSDIPRLLISGILDSNSNAFALEYNGSSWTDLDTSISADVSGSLTSWIAVGHNDYPYVVHRDGSGIIQVRSYSGSAWNVTSTLGGNDNLFSEGMHPPVAKSQRGPVTASPFVNPYLYVMASTQDDGEILVAELDSAGAWTIIGTGAEIGFASSPDYDLAIGYDGLPYVVFRSAGDDIVNVKSFNGSSWTSVGAENPFPGGPIRHLKIVAQGNGYAAVAGRDSFGIISIWDFDGDTWNSAGLPTSAPNLVDYDLALVDQTLFLANHAGSSLRVFYKKFSDNWHEMVSMNTTGLSNPHFSSDGRNLFMVTESATGLVVHQLEAYGGFYDPGQ